MNKSFSIIPLPTLASADLIDRLWLRYTVSTSLGTSLPSNSIWGALIRKTCTIIKLFRGDHSQSWQPITKMAISRVLNHTRVNLCMACHGPDASLYLAKWTGRKYKIPWLVDFRDPILQPQRTEVRFFYRLFLKYVLLRHSSFLVNVTPVWAEFDKADFNKPVFCITNGYDETEFNVSHPSNPVMKILALGNISYPSNEQMFFEALERLKSCADNNSWEFVYRGNLHETFEMMATKAGVSEYCNIGPSVPRNIALNLMCQADVLVLFSMDVTKNSDPYLSKGYYPGKIFEFMACKKAVLCIPGDHGQLDNLVIETGIGRSCGTVDDIVNFVQGVKKGNYHPDFEEIKKYSRKNGARRLAQIMDQYSLECAE
ncbi:MAG: hypothetical protein MJA30_33465 [Cytophagales bacterium]|nr:hypothetical protein [Cytophagales bacterium]